MLHNIISHLQVITQSSVDWYNKVTVYRVSFFVVLWGDWQGGKSSCKTCSWLFRIFWNKRRPESLSMSLNLSSSGGQKPHCLPRLRKASSRWRSVDRRRNRRGQSTARRPGRRCRRRGQSMRGSVQSGSRFYKLTTLLQKKYFLTSYFVLLVFMRRELP